MSLRKIIKILWPEELPDGLTGKIAVVVDVLAATSNIAAFLDAGVGNLLLTNDENVLAAKERYPDAYVIGESNRSEVKAIINASNSPALLEQNKVLEQIAGRTVLYLTNNGTKVISEVLSRGADKVVTASFVNLDKVAAWLDPPSLKLRWASGKKNETETEIVIVPAGERSFTEREKRKVEEDLTCAKVLAAGVVGDMKDPPSLKLRRGKYEGEIKERVKSFILGNYAPLYQAAGIPVEIMERDIEIILDFDSRPVVPLCTGRDDGLIEVKVLAITS